VTPGCCSSTDYGGSVLSGFKRWPFGDLDLLRSVWQEEGPARRLAVSKAGYRPWWRLLIPEAVYSWMGPPAKLLNSHSLEQGDEREHGGRGRPPCVHISFRLAFCTTE